MDHREQQSFYISKYSDISRCIYVFFRTSVVKPSDRMQVMENGSLYIDGVAGSDAANYTCHAENTHGADDITYILRVQGQSGALCVYRG